MSDPFEPSAPFAASDESAPALEVRRVALEELKAQHEYELRTRELDLKRAESGWGSRLFTPLTTTIFAGILTLAASVVGTLLQSSNALDLERQKFVANKDLELRKEQHELILKMVSVGDVEKARTNLRFLAESQLIDPEVAKRVLAAKDTPVLPSSVSAGPSSAQQFQAVRSDDDALDLVLAWQGGFSAGSSPTDLASATNAGITLSVLSQLLGHSASIEELKALSPAKIKDYYRHYLAPAAGLESPLVRAAFLNLSVMSGRGTATRVFQEAGQQIGGTTLTLDGSFGPLSISTINSAAAKDPELLVETANCIALKEMKSFHSWQLFGPFWTKRLRAFSPVVLRGVCSELQAADRGGAEAAKLK